jgi:TolB-like protein/class 3 adenylate cyclase/Tfp pilus assembly protein PilF
VTSSRKLAAIVSADVVGYSQLMGQDDHGTLETLTAHRKIILAHVLQHGGRVVDAPGDALLAEFPSAVEAVRACSEIQRDLHDRNALRPEDRRMRWRLGVNLGDVIEDNGALYGDGVNVAARLQSLSEPGGLCISGTVFDQVEGKLPLQFSFAGEQAVKNITRPVRAYHVARAGSPGRPPSRQPQPGSRKRRLVAISSIFVMAAAGALAWHISNRSNTGKPDAILTMPAGPTVAVLPFENISGNSEEEYFSDGLTEDIITELARNRELNVLARNLTQQYRNQPPDPPAAGLRLGADYVLEGSVRRSGTRVRITAQLIDVRNGAHIWAERYDREFEDIFVVQDEIATRVAGAIAGGWAGSLHAARAKDAQRKSPDQLRAYDLVLQHTAFYVSYTPDAYAKAKLLLERAMALDPDYARAKRDYAWLLLIGWVWRLEPLPLPAREVKENAIRSVELDPTDPYARRTAAFAYYFDKEFDLFERESRMALDLAPNNADILAQLGFLTAIHGDWDRGVPLVSKAYRINPASAGGWHDAARFFDYYRRGMYADALRMVKQHRGQGEVETQQMYVAVYAELGDLDKAREHWEKCRQLDPEWSADKLAQQILALWSFEPTFSARYLQSLAKAGYRTTADTTRTEPEQ